jgi:hypothetical protein
VRRALALFASLTLLSTVAASAVAQDDHSENMHLVGSLAAPNATDVVFTKDGYAVMTAQGSDTGAGLYVIDVHNPAQPKTVGRLPCAGSGYDVGLWRNIAVMSIDSGSGNTSTKEDKCNLKGTEGKEGIRLVDISDRAHPHEVKFVETPCGSHTNITFGHKGRGLVYVDSYSASTSGTCSSAHGIISVVDITRPRKAKIVAQPSVFPANGCHDGHIDGHYAYMACLTEGQVWDIKNPLKPKILAHISDVPDAIWHSSTVSNDGKTVGFGFESFQAGGASCTGQTENGPTGAIYFYDVSDPTAPKQLGSFTPPRTITGVCTAHNFTTIPGIEKDILVTAWYSAGVMAVDYSDPSAPTEIAHYLPAGTSTWDANWYKGHVYVGDSGRGLDVYTIDGI